MCDCPSPSRCSHRSRFRGSDGKESDPRHHCNFLFPKDDEIQDNWGTQAAYKGEVGRIIPLLKRAKLDALAVKIGMDKAKQLINKIKPDNFAVRDGDFEKYDGYDGCLYISAANKRPPQIIGRDRRQLTAADGIIYSGCYVNAIVTLWHQQSGVRNGQPMPDAIWAALEAVQFVEKGDAFGAPQIDVDSEFDDLTEGAEASGADDFGDSVPLI